MRVVLRSLLRAPQFTLTTVVMLTAVITVVCTFAMVLDAVEWGSRPYRDPSTLARLDGRMVRNDGVTSWPIGYVDADELRRSIPGVSIAVYGVRPFTVNAREGSSRHVEAEFVSAEYFDVLGVSLSSGRSFTVAEERAPHALPFAVISEALSQSLGADAQNAVRTIQLDDRAFQVIGIAPSEFRGLSDRADVWLPAGMARTIYMPGFTDQRNLRWLSGVARIGPELTHAQFAQALRAYSARAEQQFAQANEGFSIEAAELETALFGHIRWPIRLLFVAALLVFGLCVANIAGIFLLRLLRRAPELATRSAIGATAWQSTRPILLESALIIACAVVCASILTWGFQAALRELAADALPRYALPHYGWRTFLAAVAGATVAFGALSVAPLLLQRQLTSSPLHSNRTSTAPRSVRRLFSALVIAQSTVTIALLGCGVLLTRGLLDQLDTDLGLDKDGLYTARLNVSGNRYADVSRVHVLVDDALAQLRLLPGVVAASVEGPGLPTSTGYGVNVRTGHSAVDAQPFTVQRHHIVPGYFATLKIPLVRGREFGTADRSGGAPVVIVSADAAQQLFGRDDVIGEELMTLGPAARTWTIVGVVRNVRHTGLGIDSPIGPDIYVPIHQWFSRNPATLTLFVRTDRRADALRAVRDVIGRIDAQLALFDERTLDARLAEQTWSSRILTLVIMGFAIIALTLASLGVFAMVGYRVSMMRRETAIRMAFGATAQRVRSTVVGIGIAPVLIGLTAGVPAIVILGHVLASKVRGVAEVDLASIAVPSMLMIAVAALATVGPVRQALGLSVAEVLKSD